MRLFGGVEKVRGLLKPRFVPHAMWYEEAGGGLAGASNVRGRAKAWDTLGCCATCCNCLLGFLDIGNE